MSTVFATTLVLSRFHECIIIQNATHTPVKCSRKHDIGRVSPFACPQKNKFDTSFSLYPISQEIKTSSSTNCLGVVLDSSLNFRDDVLSVILK